MGDEIVIIEGGESGEHEMAAGDVTSELVEVGAERETSEG